MKYLDKNGLITLLNQSKGSFGQKTIIETARNAFDNYILNIDYTILEFNTSNIVTESTSSAVLGSATLGQMVLGIG